MILKLSFYIFSLWQPEKGSCKYYLYEYVNKRFKYQNTQKDAFLMINWFHYAMLFEVW